MEYPDGDKYWYKEGKLHREDRPAVEHYDGTKEWWVEGRLHRTDGPAIEYTNGTKGWYVNGELYRENGPTIEWGNNVTSCLIDDVAYYSSHLYVLIKNHIFLGIEIGKYNLEWLRFMTETGIEEFPNLRNLKESDIQKEMKIK